MKRSFLFGLCVFFVFCLLLRCGSDDSIEPSTVAVEQDSTILSFFETVGNDSATVDENGIYSYPIVLNPGGASASGGVLSIYYRVGTLGGSGDIDVYSSSDGDPIVLKQGSNAVYPVGLDLALAQMNEGETYGFVIPSSLAYDTVNLAGISENAIIEFEIELVSVQSVSQVEADEDEAIETYVEAINVMVREARQTLIDSLTLAISDSTQLANALDSLENVPLDTVMELSAGIYFQNLTPDSLFTGGPMAGQIIGINYSGRFIDSTSFDSRFEDQAFEYAFGTNLVIPGLDLGIGEMQFEQEALIIMASDLAYRESAVVIPSSFTQQAISSSIVPDYAARVGAYRSLAFEVTLLTPN